MSTKFVHWLYAELPDLVARGVLTTDAAERLRQHYGEVDKDRWRQVGLTLSAVLGSLLVGLGIIFLVAHNWSDLSRAVRTFFAVGPLIGAQVLAGWVAWRKEASVAWREGAATLLMLALGASIALVQQTYNTPGDVDTLLLVWMLLSLPLVYLLNVSAPAVLYLVGVILWAESAELKGAEAAYIGLLGALVIPHFVQALRADRYAVRPVLLAWALVVWAAAAFWWVLKGASNSHVYDDELLWMTGYLGLFASSYLVGALWFGEASSIWRRPFQLVGAGGVAVISYGLSFRHWIWSDSDLWEWDRLFDAEQSAMLYLVGAICLIAVALTVLAVVKHMPGRAIFGVAPLVMALALALANGWDRELAPALVFNGYVVVLGAATLVAGVMRRRLAPANAGVVLLALLIAARFTDSELGLLVRGIACLVVGAGFLATNLIVYRLRKGAAR
jgi:hypothetical protein